MAEQLQSSSPSGAENLSRPPPKGLYYARWAGILTALGLLFYGPLSLAASGPQVSGFEWFRGIFFMFYGLVLAAPLHRLNSEKMWKKAFTGLVLLSVLFVFTLIVSVMFDYMAAAERGERLGVPGREGTFIFLSLLQVPVALFLRRPDLLD